MILYGTAFWLWFCFSNSDTLWIHLKYMKIRFFDKKWPIASAAPLVFFERLRQRRPKTLAHRENMKSWWPHEGGRSIPSQSCGHLILFLTLLPQAVQEKKTIHFPRCRHGLRSNLRMCTKQQPWIKHGIWIFWRISYFWIKSCCPKAMKFMEISDILT